MSDLIKKKCVPCEGGVIPFNISEIHKYQKKVDGWSLIENENIFFLEKDFKFKNFVESQNFVNDVGKISEEEGHHPDIIFGWGYAKIKSFSDNPSIACVVILIIAYPQPKIISGWCLSSSEIFPTSFINF